MAKVVVFGKRDYAEQAAYYLTHDSPHEVAAFSVTSDHVDAAEAFGHPLVAFEEIDEKFPPDDFEFFVPASGRRMNRTRREFYEAAKAKGYRFVSYVSSHATVCHSEVGENCFIFEHTSVQPFGRVGDNTIIWCQTHVGHHSSVGSHCFLSAGVMVSGRCHVGDHCYLSGNAAVDAGSTLAEGTLVGMGAVVKSVPEPWGIYTGNPARRRRISSRDFEFL